MGSSAFAQRQEKSELSPASARCWWGRNSSASCHSSVLGRQANRGTAAKWERSSAMWLLSRLETRQHLGKFPHATPSQVLHIKGVFFIYLFFYQGKTSSIHVPNELLIPSKRLLTQLPINSICDAHKWLQSLHKPTSMWTFTHYCHRLNLSWWQGTDVKGSLILSCSNQCWKYFLGFFEAYRPSSLLKKWSRSPKVCVLTVSKQRVLRKEKEHLSPDHLRYCSIIQKPKEDCKCPHLFTDQPPWWEVEDGTEI